MNDHFIGIVPAERWKNDVLNELRAIRQLLERNVQTLNQEPEEEKLVQTPQIQPTKRKYNRRGA